MVKKLFDVAMIAGIAFIGIAAVPASAQDYGRGGYSQSYGRDDRAADDEDRYARDDRYQNYRQQNEYRGYNEQQRRYDNTRRYQSYDPGYSNNGHVQGYADRGGYARSQHRDDRRCSSGTTGAVLGAVLGGLLGREVGRGGRYNTPSTTGLILGAGGGALAGRAIEQNGNCR